MRKKYSLSLIALMLVGVFGFSSCGDDNNGTPTEFEKPVVKIETLSTTHNSVTVKITAEGTTEKYEYAIGLESDRASFEKGSIQKLKTSKNSEALEIAFEELNENTEYVVYARGIDKQGQRGNVVSADVITAKGPDKPFVKCEFLRLNPSRCIVEFVPTETVSKYYVTLDEPSSYFQKKQLYEQMGGVESDFILSEGKEYTGIAEENVTLLENVGQRYIIAIAIFRLDGELEKIHYEYFNTQYEEGLPTPGDVKIEVSEVTAINARIKLTPGENTLGYTVMVTRASWYDGKMADQTTSPAQKKEIILSAILKNGSKFKVADDAVWAMKASEDLIVIAAGYNENGFVGTEGYGNISVSRFSTPAE